MLAILLLKKWSHRFGRRMSLKGPEPGRAAHAACVSMLRGQHRRFGLSPEDVFLQAARNVLVKTRDLRKPATQNDDVRIEQIDDPCQRAREPFFQSLKRRERVRLSCLASRNDFRAAERAFSGALVIVFEAGSGHPGFHAAISSAITRRTWKFIRAHPRQGVMSPLAG